KYTIKLDTGLKIDDATGQIESYEEYVYQIYIKYILVNSGESYYTYRDYGESGSFVTNAFYMSTYTVYIDRSPNSSNLESLMGTQGNFFTDYQRYVSEQEDINFDEDVNTVYAYRNSIPAQDYYALVNDLYYQLVGKSQTNTEVKVEPAMYALNVDYTTTLNMDELSRVYYRQLMFDSQIGTDTKMSLLPVFKDYSSVGYHSFNENLPIYQVVVHTDLEVKEGEYYYHKILGLDKNNLENDYNNKYGGYYEIIEKDKAGNYTQYIIYFAPKTATDINIDIYGKNISRINNVAQDSETTITINSKNTTQTTFIGIDKVDNLSGLVHEIGIGSKRYTQYYGNINIYNSSREKVREIYTNSVSKHAVYDVNGVKQTGIESDIYETIKNQGNYIIEYVDVYGNKYSTIINNYTSDEHQLNIANLQLKTDYDGQQYITISGVNSQIDGNTYWYVTEVLVEYGNTTIIYKVQSHKNGITTLEGESIDNNVSLVAPDRLNLAKDNIYLITLTDVANEKYSVMLSTGKDYGYKLFTPDNVYMQNNVVYSASEIELSYNTNFYNVKVEVYLNDSTTPETSNNDYYTDLPSNNYNTLTLKPDAVVNPADHYGSLRRFKVSLCRNDASNEVIQVYEIWIDTRATTFRIENLNKVDKIEFVKSTLHNSQSDYNIIDLKDNMFYTNLISETVNITWTRLTSNYFTYNYDLYEFTSKDEYNKLLINSTTTKYQFAPKDSNTGKYILKITIQGKDGTWIASKVYGIYMSTTITGLYEVKDGNGEVYDYSVITNLSEVMASIGGNESAMALALNLSVNDMKKIFNGFGAKTAIPMYIANKQLMLHSNADNGVRADCYSPSSSSYTTIKFYHIYRSNYRTFAVIMEVYDNSFDKGDILSTLSFITKSEQDGESLLTGGTAKTIYDANAEFYKLSFNSYNRNTSLSALERHNKIIIDVYYDGEFAKRIVGGYGELTSIEFKNGGSYKLSIRDMAGNIQYFRTTASYSDTFTLIVMKDLLYKINNCAPIQYAY
ncbi:MAG: hypothetical protein J6Q15_02010, partial [Clostridia bacterium]|nr:hypothetical protein [Clostridia bacterium]